MTAVDWKRVVEALLYSVQFDALDDELADRRAHALVLEPPAGLTPEQCYEALGVASRSGDRLTGLLPAPVDHAEADFRDFLNRVRNGMDAQRPWPAPPFEVLDSALWPEFAEGTGIGRLDVPVPELEARLRYGLRSVADGEGARLALILRLGSGDEVAVVTPWWQDTDDVALVRRRDDTGRSAEQVRRAFVDATGRRLADIGEPAGDGAQSSLGRRIQSTR